MSKDDQLRDRIEAYKQGTPLEKVRRFLGEFAVATVDLAIIRDNVRHSLGFNVIPATAGRDGLEALLAEPPPDEEVVALVAGNKRPTLTPDAARRFLTDVLAILRAELPAEELPEGLVFGPEAISLMRDDAGALVRVRCLDALALDKDNWFGIFTPEDTESPFWVYRYKLDGYGRPIYERVDDQATRERVWRAHKDAAQ